MDDIPYNLVIMFYDWFTYQLSTSVELKPPLLSQSLEKMWVSSYMKKKHSKVWDGEKWVKVSEK